MRFFHGLKSHLFKDIDGMGETMAIEQTVSMSPDAQRGSLRGVPTKGKGEGRVGVDSIDTSRKHVDKKLQDRLVNPSPLIKMFEPTADKMKALAKHLMENKFSLSDELRNYDTIHAILNRYISSPNCIFYEIGDMDGVFGFTDIMFGWKAHVIFELLNPRIWSKQLVRESNHLFDLVMKTGDLIKLSSQTADTRVRRMSKMIRFKIEGIRRKEFYWDKELYDTYLIGRTRPTGRIRSREVKDGVL